MRLFRLTLITLAALMLLLNGAHAGSPLHGLSAFGELKYKADFKHFDYVNPSAPKGGRLSLIGPSRLKTFNSFNRFILKGDEAQGLDMMFDSLMARAHDEPDAMYGLVAHSAVLADDKLSVTFNLRREARFSDDTPITARDVVFSYDTLKTRGHPSYGLQLRDVVKAEAINDHTVKYHFKGEQVRDLPRLVASLPVLSAKYYAEHDFTKTTLEPPLASGPYKIKSYDQRRHVTYERRKDYWAKDLPVNRGQYNFDEIRFEYYLDRTAEFEGLKSGNYDLREEFTSRDWATKYDIEPIRSGRMIKENLPDNSPSGAQGFFLNLRRDKFRDIRVREAFGLAFDFEWTNKNLFYGAYQRTHSYFENSEMKAMGKPGDDEIKALRAAIMELHKKRKGLKKTVPYLDHIPPSFFNAPYVPPVTSGTGKDRRNLRKALRLLHEAGWKAGRDGVLRNKTGETFTAEFLIFSPAFERIIAPYVRNLKILGIKAHIRMVDSSQYERRLKDFDFDITTSRFVLGLTPGVGMRNYWSSASADTKGSRNLAGFKDPLIDILVEKMIKAKSRSELVTTARTLDRVLRAGHYWIPQWYYPFHRMAYWDKFGRPDKKPPYDRAIINTWWVDPEKQAKLKQK